MTIVGIVSYRRRDRDAEGVEGKGYVEGMFPPQPTRESGKRCKLPQWQRSPGRIEFWAFGAFRLCPNTFDSDKCTYLITFTITKHKTSCIVFVPVTQLKQCENFFSSPIGGGG